MSDTLSCASDRRREDILASESLLGINGIDYVEVDAEDHRTLLVFFLLAIPPDDPADPDSERDAYGLADDPAGRISIAGGARVIGIRATSARRRVEPAVHPHAFLEVRVDRPGDHSRYTISLTAEALDPRRRTAPLSFVASCPVEHDCREDERCPPPQAPAPDLDYMAKDYPSFRRMLLDLAARLSPAWTERSPVDLGVMLVELLAYEGDQLSWMQDAILTEGSIETARRRISLRRHARLVDYRMHDGRNAWTWVHLAVDQVRTLPARTALLTRLARSPGGGSAAPRPIVARSLSEALLAPPALGSDPALRAAVVFETARALDADPLHSELRIHTWGDEECCLPRGATAIDVFAVRDGVAVRPSLRAGDHVLVEEVLGVRSADPADRDPEARVVVTLVDAQDISDPLYSATLDDDGAPSLRGDGEPELPLRRLRWSGVDAPIRPLCLSTRLDSDEVVRDVCVARGNVVAADHGLTIDERIDLPAERDPSRSVSLANGPITWQHGRFRPGPPAEPTATDGDPDRRRGTLAAPASEARPALEVTSVAAGGLDPWEAVADLLDSTPFDRHVVVETDDDGRATLRFGDGEYGRRLGDASALEVSYRVGVGGHANIGEGSLGHVVLEDASEQWIERVYNPLPAVGGADPEPIEAVRRDAPVAFHTRQLRAVTAQDYRAAAEELTRVAGAVAAVRWTGSWQTVFVGIDPRAPSDLVLEPNGRIRLADDLAHEVRVHLQRRRLAGRDLELRAPEYVPIDLALVVCAGRDHFREDVAGAVVEALSDRVLADRTVGLFHPDRFGFGDPVHLSAIYAAAAAVPGVDSVTVRRFKRYRERPVGELDRGVLGIGDWELAQLRNDPSFPEHGVLEVTALGGKA